MKLYYKVCIGGCMDEITLCVYIWEVLIEKIKTSFKVLSN